MHRADVRALLFAIQRHVAGDMPDDTDPTDDIFNAGSQAESAWLSALQSAQAAIEKATTDKGQTFYPPSEEQLGWTDVNTKLVRLDVAILAVHLITARVAFKAFPKASQIILGKIIGKVQEKAGEWAEKKAAKEIPKSNVLVGLMNFILSTVRSAVISKSLELTIKNETFGGMKAIRAICLAHKAKKKRTRTVQTRHYSPRQRSYAHSR